MKLFIFSILFLFIYNCFSQTVFVDRIDPPFWWADMKTNKIKLLIHGKNINDCSVKTDQKNIKILKVDKLESPDYLMVSIEIPKTTKAGKYSITFSKNNDGYLYQFELKDRIKTASKGLSSADLIYLLIPDRFANGDTTNDFIPSMAEKYFSRDSAMSRHGGDIQGIINHLDYFKNLNVTALWLTPVWENNQPKASYHGYAPTDHYRVDARLGTTEKYCELVQKAHQKGLKIIMDLVFNHVGNNHWLITEPPSKNIIHNFSLFTMSNFKDATLLDPYASQFDKTIFSNGWFDTHMPDLNQQDSLVSSYLIQNSIWWIELTGVDAIRLDTYAYPDQQFMANWTKAVLNEYPNLGLFGETWVSSVANQAYYSINSGLKNPVKPLLPGITDFQLYNAISNALTKDFGWTDGVAAIYYCLTNDYLYENAFRNVIFLDNHDVSRIFSVVNEDVEKLKMGIAFLLTTRGIPCLYYGTEILMKNFANKHENVRRDFPGGWTTDKIDKFNSDKQTEIEKDIFYYISKLSAYRKNNPVLQTGKLMQFVPKDGIYVYFRYNSDKTVMVIMNQNIDKKIITFEPYYEVLRSFSQAYEIISGKKISELKQISLAGKSVQILELIKQ